MHGMLARKIGMTRIFADGRQIPVTVLECGPCVIVQRKRREKEGYDAVQVGFGAMAERKLNKPSLARFKKVNAGACRHLAEFALPPGSDPREGEVLTVAMFQDVPYVDVEGFSKGKGFQGVVKRHGMRGGVMTHGSHVRRRPGAVGARELPGRIHKGKRMPGHDGNACVTQQNLEVVRVMTEDNVLLVRGAVPGCNGALLRVCKALKKGNGKS